MIAMNMKQLRYVLLLANTGSFGKAAELLDISQPSLSQYIKKIEKQVGIALFDRTCGNVRLTDAGQVYVEVGKKILDLEHQMQSRFSDIVAYKTGSVIVGTSPYRSASMMPFAAKKFQEKYPGMHIVVEEMTTSELLEATEHGQFDFCLTMLPVEERLFCYEKIMEEELVLAVPASFRKFKIIENASSVLHRTYPVIDASEINGESFVMITESQVMQKELENLCACYGLEVKKAAVVKSLEAQIAMVRAGVGMALVPTGIDSFCAEGEVVFYSFQQELPKREVVAMWRKDRQLNQATRDLIEVMKALKQ